MTWVKLDDGFLTHPKVLAAGKDGRALIVSGLCYCAQGLTDGLIVDGALPMVAGAADVKARPTAGRLVGLGIWHREDHSCPSCPPCPTGHYLVHDYLSYQPPAEEEKRKRRELSEKRAAAGRKGALSRWGSESNPGSNGDGKPPDLPSQSDGSGMAPSPTPTVGIPSQQQQTAVAGAATSTAAAVLVDAVVEALIETRGKHQAKLKHKDPSGWLAGARRGIRAEVAGVVAQLHAAHPELTPEAIARAVDGPPTAHVAPGGSRAPWEPPACADCPRCGGKGVYELPGDRGMDFCDHEPDARPVLRAVP